MQLPKTEGQPTAPPSPAALQVGVKTTHGATSANGGVYTFM